MNFDRYSPSEVLTLIHVFPGYNWDHNWDPHFPILGSGTRFEAYYGGSGNTLDFMLLLLLVVGCWLLLLLLVVVVVVFRFFGAPPLKFKTCFNSRMLVPPWLLEPS